MNNSQLNARSKILLLRGSLLISALLFTSGLVQLIYAVGLVVNLRISTRWQLGILSLALLAVLLWGLFILSLSRAHDRLVRGVNSFGAYAGKIGKANGLIFLAALLGFVFLYYGTRPNYTYGLLTRLFLVWAVTLVGTACLKALYPQKSVLFWAPVSLLVTASVFQAAQYIPQITSYPLTLSWSETDYFYYASLFFAQRFYGAPAQLPSINPGHALLASLPYLLPQPQLWINRLWDAFLWLATSGLAAWLLARRLQITDRFLSSGFIALAFLYIFQGPVYYELLVCVILVLWLFKPRHFWRSLLVIVLASMWAGICRLNWFPMPGVLAGVLYLLETPTENKAWTKYLWKPAAWFFVGLAAAFAASAIYTGLSGDLNSRVTSSLQSPLLWYRLLPSATDAWGVLPKAALAALPGLLVLAWWLARHGSRWNFWRKAGLLAALLVFFAGGIIVSIKIGGGAGIHNLDAFWCLLLVICGYLYFNRTPPDQPQEFTGIRVPLRLVALFLSIPLFLILLPLSYPPAPDLPSLDLVERRLETIRQLMNNAIQNGTEVLFVNNRHLVTFGYVPRIPMLTNYDTVYMEEMAMSGNTAYFEKFTQDLKTKRFGVIFTHVQPIRIQTPAEAFAEENNVQVMAVGQPLFCYYQVEETWLEIGIEVFTPRPSGCE